jgi:hypothetical protein
MEAVETSTTPVASPEPTSSPAPAATPQATPAPTTSERPKSFAEALERVATQTTPDATVPAAPAIAAPVAPAAPVQTPTPNTPGPLLADHQKILENTRVKTRAEVMAEVDRTIGWARHVPQESFQEVAGFAQRLHQDPVGFYRWLGQELANHPQYSQQLRGTGQPTQAQEPQPDVEIHDGNGRVVGMTYSAQRLAEREQWLTGKVTAQVSQELRPLQQAHERAQQEASRAALETKVNQGADVLLARIDKILDGRKDLHTKVNDLLKSDPQLDPLDAAFRIRDEVIAPNVQATAEAKLAEQQKRKALGNTANGNGAVVAPAVRPKNPKELAALLANLEGARS